MGFDRRAHEVRERRLTQGLSGDVDGKTRAEFAQGCGRRCEGLHDPLDDPAIEAFEHLITLGRVQIVRQRREAAVDVLKAHENLIVVRPSARSERDDRLRVQDEAVGIQRIDDHARFAHGGMAADHRVVAGIVDLDAVAAALLGDAADGLGGGERVLKGGIARQTDDAEARRDARRRIVERQSLDRLSDLLGPIARLVQGIVE